VEAVDALPVAGDAVVGELELAGAAASSPFALLSLASGPTCHSHARAGGNRSRPRAGAARAEGVGPRRL
jgi:hypothetical protein